MMSILFANYVIRSRGHEAIYLGSQTPFEDLYQIFDVRRPDYIFSIITSLNSNVSLQTFINHLGKHWKTTKVLLSGAQIVNRKDLKFQDNMVVLPSPANLLDFIQSIPE